MKRKWFLVILTILVLASVTVALAYAQGNIQRSNPQYVTSGEWFEVEITFTAPTDETNAVGIADNLEGASVRVDSECCFPSGAYVNTNSEANMIEAAWAASFNAGDEMVLVYEAMVEGEPMDEFIFTGCVYYFDGQRTCYEPKNKEPYCEDIIQEDIPETVVKIRPDMSFVLGAVNAWLAGDSSMADALVVINAWVS